MRTRLIASLVSLSLASAHGVCAQEALWFTPSEPAVTTIEPTAEELSFARRFGGLLNKPKTQSQATQPQPSHASQRTGDEQKKVVTPASGQHSGVREFEIPWSVTASAPFDFDQHAAASKSDKGSASAKGRGAQVGPMAAQVRANYVQSPASAPQTPVALPTSAPAVAPHPTTVADIILWQGNRSQPNRVLAEQPNLQLNNPQPNAVQRLPLPIAERMPQPLIASTPIQPEPIAQLTESLIQPVPEAKLSQSVVQRVPTLELDAPRVATPTLPPGTGRLASSPLHLVSPNHYTLTDEQQSASDRVGSTVVPAPPISERLTDQAKQQPAVDQSTDPKMSAKIPATPRTPLLTTESMIGPLKGAEQLFYRLDLEHDMRHVAARIESGPRGDASNYAWMPAAYTWISPALYHHPLYFEQPNLERYGIGPRPALQPLASSMHFFGSIPLVPYKTLTHHPRERVYTLGEMRPGNCVPMQRGVILGQSTVGEVAMFWEECSGY